MNKPTINVDRVAAPQPPAAPAPVPAVATNPEFRWRLLVYGPHENEPELYVAQLPWTLTATLRQHPEALTTVLVQSAQERLHLQGVRFSDTPADQYFLIPPELRTACAQASDV